MSTNDIFRKKPYSVLLAVTAMFAWGAAFPLIKLGMAAFAVGSNDAPGKLLFAGIRFGIAGGITLLFAKARGTELAPRRGSLKWVLLYGLVNTALHYFCFYMGLSQCSGSKSSIIDSFGTFELILLACLIFRERMTGWKAAGIALGLGGILVTNLGGDVSGGFRLAGEGMMLAATICAAFGGILARVVTAKNDVIAVTGWGLLTGGVLLTAAGLITGGRITRVTPMGILILCGLVTISTVAFILYNQLLRDNPVSEIAIYNALIPCFGTMLSCLLLGETFYPKYLIGIALIAVGIWAVNRNTAKQ